jgi:hypothetical protein
VIYHHRLRITKPGPGSQLADGGWTGGAVTVLDVAADVQDRGAGLRRTPEGVPAEDSDAVAFLPRGTDTAAVKPEMRALITWADGSTQVATVVRPRRLDQTIVLKYV